MLEVKNIQLSFGDRHILRDVCFAVQEGQIVTLIGASGSGKTSLFRLITGLLNPCSGTIKVSDNLLPDGGTHVSYMMQEDLLLPWRTTYQNLTLLRELGKGTSRPEMSVSNIKELLASIGLSGTEDLYPTQMSGGMRQRLSLARALLQERPLILLDEPFGALDAITREQMYRLLRDLRQRLNRTLLMITHDFRDAVVLSDRILLLGDGVIQKSWNLSDIDRNDTAAVGALQEQLRLAMQENVTAKRFA